MRTIKLASRHVPALISGALMAVGQPAPERLTGSEIISPYRELRRLLWALDFVEPVLTYLSHPLEAFKEIIVDRHLVPFQRADDNVIDAVTLHQRRGVDCSHIDTLDLRLALD